MAPSTHSDEVIPDVDFGELVGPDDEDPGVTAISTDPAKIAEGQEWTRAAAGKVEGSTLDNGVNFESDADMGDGHPDGDPMGPTPLRPIAGRIGPSDESDDDEPAKKAPAKKAAAKKAPSKKAAAKR